MSDTDKKDYKKKEKRLGTHLITHLDNLKTAGKIAFTTTCLPAKNLLAGKRFLHNVLPLRKLRGQWWPRLSICFAGVNTFGWAAGPLWLRALNRRVHCCPTPPTLQANARPTKEVHSKLVCRPNFLPLGIFLHVSEKTERQSIRRFCSARFTRRSGSNAFGSFSRSPSRVRADGKWS